MSRQYPVAERLNHDDYKALGITFRDVKGPLPTVGMNVVGVVAEYIREFREPKKGEWYLSGSIVEAYRAPNDYTPGNRFHIAKLVYVGIKAMPNGKMPANS